MAWIELDGVTVEFPVIAGRSMSLKRSVLAFARNLGRTAGADQLRAVTALRDLSFAVKDGDRVGLIGLNGCGKSTLLRVLAGIYEPVRGEVRVAGHTNALIDLGLGFDFEATGYENITLRGYAIG